MIENQSIKVSAINRSLFYGLIVGGVAVLITLGYFVAIIALPRADSPSSTDGVAYLYGLFFLFFVGIAGLLVGSLVGWLVDSFLFETGIIKNRKTVRVLTSLILIGVIIFFSYPIVIEKYQNAKTFSEKYNAKNTKEVKYDAGIIEKIQINTNDLKNYNLDLNKNHIIAYFEDEGSPKEKEFDWNGKKYTIIEDGRTHIFVKNSDGSTFISHSTAGYNYVVTNSFVVYGNSGKSYLFVLSRLRATSQQSLLNVFSEKGESIYEELMAAANVVEIGEMNGEKVIIIGDRSVDASGKVYMKLKDFIYKIKK